jgi:hypothetical protein
MTKEIHINNTTDLLDFIKRDEATAKQGTEVVCKVLNVISLSDKTKAELIEVTEYFIKNYYCNNGGEKPIFLEMYFLDVGNRKLIN